MPDPAKCLLPKFLDRPFRGHQPVDLPARVLQRCPDGMDSIEPKAGCRLVRALVPLRLWFAPLVGLRLAFFGSQGVASKQLMGEGDFRDRPRLVFY